MNHINSRLIPVILLIFIVSAIPGKSIADNKFPIIDSLLLSVDSSAHQKEVVQCYLSISSLADSLRDFRSIDIAENAVKHALASSSKELISAGRFNLAKVLMSKHFNAEAMDNLLLALELFKQLKDSAKTAQTYHLLATLNNSIKQYAPAKRYIKKSLEINSALGLFNEIAGNYHQSALIYKASKQYDSALVNFKRSKDMYARAGNQTYETASLIESAYIYQDLKQYDKALEFLFGSEILCINYNNFDHLAYVYRKIGIAYSQMQMYDSAEVYIRKSLALNTEIKSAIGISRSYFRLAELFTIQEDYSAAIEFLLKAYKTPHTPKNQFSILQYAEKLSEVYAKISDYENAYKYYMTFKSMSDSTAVNRNYADAALKNLQYEYRQEKAATAIDHKEKEIKMRNYIILFSVVFFIIILTAFYNYIRFRSRVRINNELENKVALRTQDLNKETAGHKLAKQKLSRLTDHLEIIREEERKNIAFEVHDELGQRLTAIKLYMFSYIKKSQSNDSKQDEKAGNILKLIDETIDTVGDISTALRPPILDSFGLAASIEWLAEDFQKKSGIVCDLDIDLSIETEEHNKVTIFRILQEALTNISRHSKASKVNIYFKKTDGYCQLTIEDNGIGIHPDKLKSTSSFGLFGMNQRAQSLGGKIVFSGNNSGGCTTTLTVPASRQDS
ncbi:MAG: ATP-binding protein [Candidatus Kapabacteria bacterium]|jgi:signal transduction histidine kinase|nr:ATP-binding protein [Candidatus Kapabacteria bacterium]